MDASTIYSQLLESFVLNVRLFGLTLLAGLPLGLVVAFGSMNRWRPLACLKGRGGRAKALLSWLSELRPVSALTKTFVWIIRGTPLMLQIIVLFYGPGLIWKAQNFWGSGYASRFAACAVAFIINYACYFSEIYRGGIESVPVGQQEAGQVLGMTKSQIFFKVTLLQVVKRIMPPVGNEVITLVKDTSLARIISNPEIIFIAQEFASSKSLIWPLFSTAFFFLAAVGILTLLLGYTERKLSYFR